MPRALKCHSGRCAVLYLHSFDLPKDSDRARIERALEEAMDNDWRVFRAKLVAQEKLDNGGRASQRSQVTRLNHVRSNYQSFLNHQTNWHSMPQSMNNNNPSFPDFIRRMDPPKPSSDSSIFAGHTVGGPHFMPNPLPGRDWQPENRNELPIEDPFDCEPLTCHGQTDLPSLTPKTNIDKHRWAHEIPLIEPGSVLIACERLGGVFHQTVVLVTQHHEINGTFGVVINRPYQGNLMSICNHRSLTVDLSMKMTFRKSRVSYGGPVMPNEYSVLHSFGEVAGSRKLCCGVYLGGSQELMNQVRMGSMDPCQALFLKGHAAWEGGQLKMEIQQGTWYMAAVSPDLILRYAGAKLTPEDNPHDLWADILTCMGGFHADVARRYGGNGDSKRLMP